MLESQLNIYNGTASTLSSPLYTTLWSTNQGLWTPTAGGLFTLGHAHLLLYDTSESAGV